MEKFSINKKSVLIVDNNEEDRENLKTILKKIDNDLFIIEALNGSDALTKISNQEFDLMITELIMPKMDGEKLLKTLGAMSSQRVPKNILVISTSHYLDDSLETGLNFSFLEKPINQERLNKYFRKVLDKETEENKYSKIPAEIVLKYSEAFPFDIYLKLSNNKLIKLGHKNEARAETFQKYVDKGVTHFYVVKSEYTGYLKELRNNLAIKFSDPDSVQPEKDFMQILNSGHTMIKDAFSQSEVSEESIELAKEIISGSMKMLEKTPNLFKFFNEFKDSCSTEFLIGIFTAYTSCLMLESYTWCSDSVKQKISLASTLCDLTLRKEDFKILKKQMHEPKKLPPKIFNHPCEVSEILSLQSTSLAFDVITIVRQHHELPDGSGFPYGLTANKITPLSAIHIVARNFIERMVKINFNYQKVNSVLNDLMKDYIRPPFKEAFVSLNNLLSASN